MRIGLVGLGKWGKTILRTLETMDGIATHRIGENIEPEIDAVIIATPSRTHVAVAKHYIEQGLPTFIEKPMTTSLQDAEELVAAAQKSRAPLFVGHIYLYNPAFWALKAALPSIGTVTHIKADGAHNRPRPHESVLWDWLPHHLCMTRELCGVDATSVRAEPIEPFSRDDAARSVFTFGGIMLDSRVNWAALERRRIFNVFGTEGSILFDDSADQKVIVKTNKGESYIEYDKTPPLTVELATFIRCVREGELDRPHVQESLAIVNMIEAAVRALESRHEIFIA